MTARAEPIAGFPSHSTLMRKRNTPKESLDSPLGIRPSPDESSKNNQSDHGQAALEELQHIRPQAANAANAFENDPLIQKALGIFKCKIEPGLRPTRCSTGRMTEREDAGVHNRGSGAEARSARPSRPAAQEAVSSGYEAAHREWLAQGGKQFRIRFGLGAQVAFYHTQYWRLVSQATLERDGFKCFRCAEQACQVHHLHYEFMWQDHLHPEALVSVCYGCHGLVEYARKAETLVPIIRRRIYSCQSFVDGMPGSGRGNPVRVFSRLLEYRERLAELTRLYESNVHYTSGATPLGSEKDKQQAARDAEFSLLARAEIDSWTGSEREKAARIIPLLDQEIQNCLEFRSRVAQPLTDARQRPEASARFRATWSPAPSRWGFLRRGGGRTKRFI